MKYAYNESLPDGSRARANEDGSWDLTLPDGHHERGETNSLDAAKAAIQSVYRDWIVSHYLQGSLDRKGRYVVPLR